MQGLKVVGSSYFWRLYVSYIAVLIVTASIVVLLIYAGTDDRVDQVCETLQDECVLVSPYAASLLRHGSLDEASARELKELGEETGLRITLVLPDGRVLADTYEDPQWMDNHSARPEVVEAREGGFGVETRWSHTVGYRMLYVAREMASEGTSLGTVRVALPLLEVEEELSSVRASVLTGTGVGLVAALVLGLFIARRISAPIAEVTRVAEGLRDGRYDSRVSQSYTGEIGVLADTMNRLGREITARIARITREDAQLRAMLAGMVEGVIAVDESEEVAFCNEAARKLLGIDGTEVVGRPLWEVIRVPGLLELLEEMRDGRDMHSGEVILGHVPNEQFLTAHAARFEAEQVGGERGLPASNGRRGLVIVLHDVTDLRRLERVRRDFVANVSHELKTPLAAIKGFVETLVDGALHDEEVNDRFLRRISENVERLSHLVTDLLSLAHIEASAGTVPRKPVNMGEIVTRVVSANREAAAAKGLRIVVDERDRLTVLGDSEAIQQVVGNLLGNAIHYTDEGQVRLVLRREDGRGIFEVEDTGEGIPRDDLDRIFERFYRVDKARSRSLGGTGLGLSIVRNLVHAMEGEVWVESTPGVGSKFTVELPLARREPARA